MMDKSCENCNKEYCTFITYRLVIDYIKRNQCIKYYHYGWKHKALAETERGENNDT